ncbi:hydrogenase iron-sulfur subunit [Herbaspirillum sp. HC18]|nr:hydrogenase iron-sulfur subunit [Herbaspirillum sp. HC18]
MHSIVSSSPSNQSAPFPVALRLLQRIESVFDRAFGSGANPWHNLGALSFFFFWVVAATGLYLFAVFDTSVIGAYQSVHDITEQWYLGGVVRSLHRYASDAFAVTITLHLLREFLYGHYLHFRRFSWISGIPLLWFAFASGINGYWLVWDRLAQFVAVGTAELFDWLPVFGGAMVRNFLTPESISDRFFSLLVFLHIGLPLLLLAGMFIHIQRISRAKSKPPRMLAWGSFAMLLVLSFAAPAVSMQPADMMVVPSDLPMDWFYLAIYPLLYAWTPGQVWGLLGGTTLLLLLIPYVQRRKRQPVAVVNLASCNGCGRCFNDCPYSAVTMQPRSDGTRHALEAVVNADQCASCGICAGSCPSSTPFRHIGQLVTGIDMPQMPIDSIRTQLKDMLGKLQGDCKLVVFGCSCAASVDALAGPDVAVFSLICSGQLTPAFVEYALRNGADGVVVTGCHEGDCAYRLGGTWTDQRLAGEREPHLRRNNIETERLLRVTAATYEFVALAAAVEAFKNRLHAVPRMTALDAGMGDDPASAEVRHD